MATPLPPLRKGNAGDEVELLQRMLADAGFDPGPSDGVFGTRTEKAVREFQAARDTVADGLAGPATLTALENLVEQMRPTPSSAGSTSTEPPPPEWSVSSEPSAPSSAESVPTEAPPTDRSTLSESAAPPSEPDTPFSLSYSVRGLLAHAEPVTSFELARIVWSDHTGYPDREHALDVLTAEAESSAADLVERSPAAWIAAVQEAIDPVGTAALSAGDRTLHGRLLLYGLGRVDRRLGGVYRREGLDTALRSDIKPDPDRIFRSLASPDAKLIADTPATVDLLDREGFANTLARLLRQQRSHEEFGTGSIPVQLFGPWGSGKTSLAGFLRRTLEQPMPGAAVAHEPEPPPKPGTEASRGPWLFVTFDAWKHQRTAPPWWWLMDRVYQEARRPPREARHDKHPVLPFDRRLSVWWWRWRWAVWTAFVLAVVGVALYFIGSQLLDWLSSTQAVLVGIAALAGALGTLYATYLTVRSSLLVGSPRTATALLHSGGDPLRRITDKYADLVQRVGRPVLVFIDNLDRCQPAYVVELLEGIQTIFADVRVTYLVAADREWVAHSFEEQYEAFAEVMGRPGRPLGYLFLEKTFAVAAPIPQPSRESRERYWQAVLRDDTKPAAVQPVPDEVRDKAVREFSSKSIDEVVESVEHLGATSVDDRARREAAAIRIVEATMRGEQDHELRPYLALMEANPRALKRLRNAVSIARAGDLAGGGSIASGDDLDGLIRWTILTLRWPLLAVRLAKRPELADLLGQQVDVAEDLGEVLAPLAHDEALRRVLMEPVDGGRQPDVPGWIGRHLADHDQPVPT